VLGICDIGLVAYKIVRTDRGFSVGQQDQYAATYGGFNFMEFSDNLHVVVNPLGIKNWIVNEFEASSFVGFSGISRESANIIDSQKNNIEKNASDVIEELHKLKNDAFEMKNSLIKGNLIKVAELIKRSWESKKKTSESISNPRIEQIIKKAEELGAWSCKVSGAGGGGFIFFMIDPLLKANAMKELSKININVRNVSYTDKGCQAWVVK